MGGDGGGAGGVTGGGGTGATGGAGGDGSACDTTKSPSEEACLVSEEFGIFVSPNGDDTSGDGTQDKPYKTLSKAVSEGGAQDKNVYACDDGGGYSETLTLDLSALDGHGMYGGFDCTSWGYSTTSKAKLGGASVALSATGRHELVVEDFEVTAANASAAGESSLG